MTDAKARKKAITKARQAVRLCFSDIVALTNEHWGNYDVVIDTPTQKRGIARIRCVKRDYGDDEDDHLPMCLWMRDMHFDKCLELYRQILIARQQHPSNRIPER